MNKRIQKMEGATKEFKEALVMLAVAFLLGILVVPYAADLLGDAIDQTLDQRKGEVERIIEAREANDRVDLALMRGGDGKRRGF
jgi:hypothetical protein